ncbi:hypothetical protein YT1_1049 [Rhodococcus ruber]|nr:hypothetical protein YT1_1049 [Rhodococcus ruber]
MLLGHGETEDVSVELRGRRHVVDSETGKGTVQHGADSSLRTMPYLFRPPSGGKLIGRAVTFFPGTDPRV